MVIDDLSWLLLFCKNQKISNCKIVTIDNPGFSITIDLQNTSFLNKSFEMSNWHSFCEQMVFKFCPIMLMGS